jgi:outer membrane receptor for ferrienterochelin and colicins
MGRLYILKATLFIILFTVHHLITAAENPPKITGEVINQSTEKHVPYLTVLIKGTTIGTSTDNSGNFVISGISPGDYVVRVQGVGYKPVEKQIHLDPGETEDLKFYIQKDVFEIEGAVVSANRNKKDRSKTPVIVNSITPKLFERMESPSLVETLNFTPGLRTENSCQNCGVTQLRMNGLEGQYTQILINSKPIFSSLSSVYGLEQLPANMIERIEVVRGGGSALFGGNAIAGTVNLITKEPLEDKYKVSAYSSLINRKTRENSVDFNTSVVNEAHTNGIYIFGMNRKRGYFDANGDGFSEIPKLNNTSVGLRSFIRPTQLSRISLDFHKIDEYRRGGNDFARLPHEADIAEEVDHNITGGSLTYDQYSEDQNGKFSAFVCGQLVKRDSYYGAQKDPAAYGRTNDLKSCAGIQYSREFDNLLFAPGELYVGAENDYGELYDRKLGFDTIPERIIADQKMNTLGGYVQSEWAFDKITFLMGVRLDHYSIMDRNERSGDIQNLVLCPRSNLLVDLSRRFQLRLSYAKGYRAPKIYSEDLHIEASQARKISHRNSEHLREETSHSFSASVDYTGKIKNLPVYLLMEGFYTHLKDPFSNKIVAENDYELTYLRVNADKGAVAQGVNFEGSVLLLDDLTFKMGWTFEDNYYKTPQQWGEKNSSATKDMLKTPDQYGYLTAGWDIDENFQVSFTGNFTGQMKVPHLGLDPENASPEALKAINSGRVIAGESLYQTGTFYDLGTKFSYQLNLSDKVRMNLHAGIKNMLNSYQENFDSGKFRDAGFIFGPTRPRTFYFSIDFENILM